MSDMDAKVEVTRAAAMNAVDYLIEAALRSIEKSDWEAVEAQTRYAAEFAQAVIGA